MVGYVPVRLCSLTRELLPSGVVELHNKGHEDSDIPCTWDIVFNLALPGWLPATSMFGEVHAGTRYTLFATASFIHVDDHSHSVGKSWFSALCSPLRFRTREVHAKECHIMINRFTTPPTVPASPTSLFPMLNYMVDAKAENENAMRDPTLVPLDVLSKIKVLVSIPEHVSMDDSSIPFVLRLRTMDLDDSECKRLQITGFSVELEQSEHYRLVVVHFCFFIWLTVTFTGQRLLLNTRGNFRFPANPSSHHVNLFGVPTLSMHSMNISKRLVFLTTFALIAHS
jgi:hypothetical protein